MTDVVCAVIEDTQGRFLACLRPQGKHLGGFWEFPGGKIDPGESPQAALTRELYEELEIHATIGPPLDPVIWSYGETKIRLMPFRCTIASGEPKTIAHELLLWCPPEQLDTLPWAAADLPILRQLATRRKINVKLTS